MIELKKTATEMLEYYKTVLFGKMGIEIEGLQNKDEAYQKWARVSVADQMLGMDAKGDFARQHAFSFFDNELRPVKKNPLMQEPQVGLAGWIVELMRLLTHLFVNNPFYHPLDLHCLDDRFPPMGEDGKKQFSPSNKELLNYLTSYTRVGVLLAKMVEHVACLEVDKIDSALFDYYVFCNNRYELNYTDKTNCFGYIDLLRDAIETVDLHLEKGYKLGLTKEEIGLIDSLWTEIPHTYPRNYVNAANEIWQRVKVVVDNFADGRKYRDDQRYFINDMVKFALPIAEKYDIDMELDDEQSLPLAYLKDWLGIIYEGDDIVYGA